jgi:hypothetical protein
MVELLPWSARMTQRSSSNSKCHWLLETLLLHLEQNMPG